MPKSEEFRRRGQECYRLSTQLQHPEYSSFAAELAKAWIGLAEYEERKKPQREPPGLPDTGRMVTADLAARGYHDELGLAM